MVFSALALAQCEVMWYFQYVGIASSKSKSTRLVPIVIDPSDPTIGFLLDGIDRLCCLVRKYIAAIRGYALSFLSSCAGRIRFLLGTPGMVSLDLDVTLKGLFQQIVQHLENIPKTQGENISAITCDLSDPSSSSSNNNANNNNNIDNLFQVMKAVEATIKKQVLSGVKPAEKKKFISELQKSDNIAAMVGDGII